MSIKTKTIKLSEPLETHKGTINELVLKDPKARSFRQHGAPFVIKSGGDIHWNDTAALGFLSDATGHDSLVLDDLSSGDYVKARNALLELLVENLGDTQNPTP